MGLTLSYAEMSALMLTFDKDDNDAIDYREFFVTIEKFRQVCLLFC